MPTTLPGRHAARVACLTLTLVLGAAAHAQGADPRQVGQWGPLLPFPELAVHAHLLPTGKVMFLGEMDHGTSVHLWDPATGAFSDVPTPPYNVFCAGHTFLPDGRLLISGGHQDMDYGLVNNVLYDPYRNAWQRVADMTYRRWYPTVTLLGNGEVLSIAGTMDPESGTALIPEVYDPARNTWRQLTGASLGLRYYPFMYLTRTGKVFMAGPVPMARMLDTSGDGRWTDVARSVWGERRSYGSSVSYGDGKVLIVGGSEGTTRATDTAETIDLDGAVPVWRSTGSMHHGRRQLNTTLLPDGTVLATGGHCGDATENDDATCPVKSAELWDPDHGNWTELASEERYRGYHSTALLLPDGRVLSAGSAKTEPTGQVFSPPYLFKGPRPHITHAPESVDYGETFVVETPEAADIRKVTVLRLGSVTHAFNQSQRISFLSFRADGGALRVTAPANTNLAPAGDYLLFVLNAAGVPSVASIVRIGGPTRLRVTAPNGGEQLRTGAATSITWTTQGSVPRVTVEYSADDGASWTALATDVANTGSLDWTVPQAETRQGRVRVRSAQGPMPTDSSDLAFGVSATGAQGTPPGGPGAGPEPDGRPRAEGCSTAAGGSVGAAGLLALAGLALGRARRRRRQDA